jgi:hypothetical protein
MPPKGAKRKDEIELDPKGWERFERAIDAAVKSGPKRRPATAASQVKIGRRKTMHVKK